MPRTYIRKKEPPSYSLEDVRRAVDDVTNKKKTFREASVYYGVPTAVIFHRIKGRKVPLDKMGGGVAKALPDRVEDHLVNCLKAKPQLNDSSISPCGSNSDKLTSSVPVSLCIEDIGCSSHTSIESNNYSFPAIINADENITSHCSSSEEPTTSVQLRVSIPEDVSPHCSGVKNRSDSALKNANAQELASPYNSFESNTKSDSGTCTDGSAALLNNILKLITLDTSTNDSVKAKLLKAISSSNAFEDNPEDIMSPNKDILDKLFKTQTNTPEKRKKIVIPRLKVATYGEVLTSDAVKDRLKKAEEEKTSKGKKIKIKVEKSIKNKGQGKRTKCANLHEEDEKEINTAKKTRLDKTDMENKEILTENNKDQCKQANFTGKNKHRKLRVYVNDSDSEEEQEVVPYAESDNSDYNIECENVECDWLEPMGTDNLIKGNFVLVKFKGGKRLATVFRYLCMVDSIDEEDTNEIEVTSLKSVDSSKQVFALNEKDTSCVPITDIIGLLPEPLISLKGERIFYKFPKPIDVFEKA